MEKLPRSTRHPKYLFGGVVAGIRDYGNRVGIPTVAGCILFDEGYLGNIVVNVACVGFGKKSQFVRNRVGSENAVFILGGGRTGRDGVLRSEEHTSELQSQSNLVCRLLLEK